MRQDLTEIVAVIDRSGSMISCREDAEGGFNAFVEKQKQEQGEARLTLVQFDTEYDFVHRGVPIKDVPKYTLEPRGGTALRDAMGRAIVETGTRLAALPEHERPGLVIVVVVTDGGENSSREYSAEQLAALRKEQEEKYSWKFIFLGANQDAFEASAQYGIAPSGVSNYNVRKSSEAYAALSGNVTRMRAASRTGKAIVNQFTDEEIRAMNKS